MQESGFEIKKGAKMEHNLRYVTLFETHFGLKRAFCNSKDVFQTEPKPIDLAPGIHARLIHTAGMTLAYVDIDAGADLPEHAHVHEQVLNLLEGEFELTLGGELMLLKAGQVVVIPSNVPHSGRALTACRAIDVFQPIREDLKALSDRP